MTSNSHIILQVAKPEDLEEILPIAIDVYCESEPVCLGIHASPDDLREFLTVGIIRWINSGLSIMARDASKNNKIVGCMLCTALTKDNVLTYGNLPANNVKSSYYQKVCALIEGSNDPFTGEITKVLEQALLAVHPDYRGQGIGLMMAKECDRLGIAAGCQLGMVSASNIATKKIFEKLGYNTIYKLPFLDFKVDGESVIDPIAGNGTTEIHILNKIFK